MRRALALALMLGHLGALALASSSSLHLWLHGDADEPHHDCAVTALLGGQLDTPDTPPVFAVPIRREEAPVADLPRPQSGIAFDASSPGRAPPAA